jgi:deoxyribonuclease-4
LRLGIHTFTSRGLEQAAITASQLGANTFQIFSSSPRMWRASLPDPAQIRLLRAARDRFDLHPLVIHVNYLVNLASCDPVIRTRSVAAFRGEIDRAVAIGAEFLVLHPGSFRGTTPEQGIAGFVEGLRDASHGVRTRGLTVLIENTAGAGCHLGSRFEELRAMRDLASQRTDVEVGFCLDTCHLLAAGFDIASQGGLRAMLKQAESTLGLNNVRVIHANDSKTPLGSNADRHQHIGKGHIGREGFHRILTCQALRSKPFILETPIDEEGDDQRNMDTLKSLAKRGALSTR